MKEMKNTAKQIVLLGGGYVAVWAYRSLFKKLRREFEDGLVKITVVCPEQYHFFHGWTAESLTGVIQDKNRMSPLSEIFTNARHILGMAIEIDADSNLVYVKTNCGDVEELRYDHLLLSVGSFDNNNVEGLADLGYRVKSHQAFLHTKQMIQQVVKNASEAETPVAQRLLSFTIAGGGFTGVELATNIAEFIEVLKKGYPSLQKIQPAIRLVNSGPRILNELQPRFEKMISYAEAAMKKYGIEILNGKKIAKVTKEGAFLNDGSFTQSTMVISTIGQYRMVLKGTEKREKDKVNRLYANRYLQIGGHENIWGGGDACHVINCKTMKVSPTNALWAIKHGECAGKNIARAIKNIPLQNFSFRGLGQTASLGIGKGIGELYGIQFTGWLAWILRLFVFNYFMPSRKVMFNEIKDWMLLLITGRRQGMIVNLEKREMENIYSNDSTDLNKMFLVKNI
jgi:NADH:quinone reductase (non-electrogenic)